MFEAIGGAGFSQPDRKLIAGDESIHFAPRSARENSSDRWRTIERQQADLSLLKADWAFLNQPANVAPIVNRHVAELNLQPLSQDQFGGIDMLPMRLKEPDTQALDSLFESLKSGVDPIQQIISESN